MISILMQRKKALIFFFLVTIHSYHFGKETLRGNADTPNETFNFNLQEYMQNHDASNVYTGAQPGEEGMDLSKEFALARITHTDEQFQGLTPQTITFNGEPNQSNPLFDQSIVAMALLESNSRSFNFTGIDENPVIVVPSEPSTVFFFVDANPKNISLRAVPNIPDAIGNITEGIIDLAASESHVFAAVKPNGSEFGGNNSGIALLMHGFKDVKIDNQVKHRRIFTIVDAPTGEIKIVDPQAARLDPTSDIVALENNLTAMGKTIDMHWDKTLQRLYIAVNVEAGNNATDGARAVVVGRLEKVEKDSENKEQQKKLFDHKLILSPIVDSTVFDGMENQIVGTRGANDTIFINKIRTMHTSTALHYLIVLGNTTLIEADHTLFALPLVTTGDADIIGTIASKNSVPQNRFSNQNDVQKLIARHLVQPAIQPVDMVTDSNPAAQIGSGPLSEDIQDIFVHGDTLFALVGQPNENKASGIYYSQALFNANGTIKGWTKWQRAGGTTDNIFGASLDQTNGNFTFMTGNDANTVNTVKRTIWSDGDKNGLQQLTKELNAQYPSDKGGIHNFFNFVPETPALSNISLLVATGLATVTLVDSGTQMDQIIIPRTGDEFDETIHFENGAITQDLTNTDIATISGGVLNTIGSITAAEIARSGNAGNNGWLFVGGTNGLAILSDNEGNGWNPGNMELGTGLTGLKDGMSFKIVGNYSFVRKIINDDNFLYIVTDTQLDRIDLTQGNVGLGQIESVTIASPGILTPSHKGVLTDCIISGPFALLGTSFGLFRIRDNNSIASAEQLSPSLWTPVALPEGVSAVAQLIPISATGRAQDITKIVGGHVYILDSYGGKNRSRLHRFSIQAIANNNLVQNDTLTHFDDLYVKNISSFLLNFGESKQNFFTDGALYFTTRNQDLSDAVFVSLTTTSPRTGIRFVGVSDKKIPITLTDSSYISALLRNVASGSFLVTGDFNTKINE